MGRIHKDGLGVDRHLHGFRFAPKALMIGRRMLTAPEGAALPDPVDVPALDQIPVFDQGSIGDCTGQAARTMTMVIVLKLTGQVVVLSAKFPYALTRDDEGTPLTEDSGCMIPDVYASLHVHGISTEALCPTLDDGVSYTQEPSDEAKADALERKGLLDYHCPDHHTIHASLAQGFPVNFGMTVFENMMSPEAAQSGEVLYPEPGEKVLGAHSVVARKFDGSKKVGNEVGAYLIRNSWSDGFGLKGEFWLPRRYIDEKLATDAMSLRAVGA